MRYLIGVPNAHIIIIILFRRYLMQQYTYTYIFKVCVHAYTHLYIQYWIIKDLHNIYFRYARERNHHEPAVFRVCRCSVYTEHQSCTYIYIYMYVIPTTVTSAQSVDL